MTDDELDHLRHLAPLPDGQFIKLVAFIEGIELDYMIAAQHKIRVIAEMRATLRKERAA